MIKDDESKGEEDNSKRVQALCEINIVDSQSFVDILPSGGAGRNIVCCILTMLDMRSLYSIISSSFIQLFCKNRNDETLYKLCKDIQIPFKKQVLYNLNEKYMTDFRGCTPFVVACQQGHLKDVDRFISISLHDDVNEIEKCSLKDLVNQVGSSDGCRSTSAISAAAIAGHFDIVHYLVKHGANAAGTPLICASEKGRIEDVNLLITKHDVESSSMTLIKMLNEGGNTSDGFRSTSAISAAAIAGHFDMVHFLAKHGANAAGTPLVCASEKGRIEDVNILITKHDVESSGMTSTEMVNQRGKDSRGIYGYTALMMAAEKADFDMIKYLLKHDADPNIANNNEWNALHYAVAYNKDNIDCIDLLLQHVAVNVNMKSRGSTPLDCVYLYNTSSIQEAIIALIRSYGGKRAEELRNDQR